MPRARNIKPALFKNEILGEADAELTLLFIGLWTLSDREGRLENRPKRIKAELFPYREIDINRYLTELERLEFICTYSVENATYIQINKFSEHQHPHKTEKASVIPAPLETTIKNKTLSVNENITDIAPLSNGSCPADSSNTDSSNTELGRARKRFKKPTVSEVAEYCEDRKNGIDPRQFLDKCESIGWVVGKNQTPMKDWRAVIRTWERNNKARTEQVDPLAGAV